jgi:hypothetical protein
VLVFKSERESIGASGRERAPGPLIKPNRPGTRAGLPRDELDRVVVQLELNLGTAAERTNMCAEITPVE